MRVKELSIRGFIEGVEIPIISASITMAPNSPAAAAVQIIATDRAHEIKPRSVVHLFFKDLYEGPGTSIYIAGEGIEFGDMEWHADKYAQILDEEQYKLLFCGEIMGYQFDKAATSRQVTLQCADFSVYWDTCWYFSGGGFFSPANMRKRFSMASGGFFEHLLLNRGEMVYKEFTTPPEGFSGVTGVLGGLIHLLQSVGGVYWKGATKFGGLNPFFSIAELKFHITQQLAVADDDGPKRLLKSKGFGSIWNRSIRGLGKNFTYRMVLNALQKYIFYEVYPCPVARFIPGTGIYDQDDDGTKLLRSHPKYSYLVIAAGQFQKSIGRLLEDFLREDRAIRTAEYRTALRRMRKELKRYNDQIDPVRKVKLNNVTKNFTKVRSRIKKLLKTLGNALPKKGTRYNQILKDLNFIDDKLRAIYGMTVQGVAKRKVKKTVEVIPERYGPTHPSEDLSATNITVTKTIEVAKKAQDLGQPPFLMNQLFRPDVWFCPPPRCNVLFPEQYSSLNFGRNYMAEVTRLLLRTHSSFFGSDILFDKFYYAPAIPGEKAKARTREGNKIPPLLQKSFLKLIDSRRDVMEHELYTGVLPKFERAGSHKVLGLRTGTTLKGGTDVGYAQRLANFLFFKYRYAARQMSVVGPFNPYIAPGFPALIIDKPADQEKALEIRKELERFSDDLSSIKEMTGTHYLGLVAGMVHNVSQTGGSTSIQLQYARTHREEVEALGADIVKAKVKKQVKTKIKRTIDIPAVTVELASEEGSIFQPQSIQQRLGLSLEPITVTLIPAQKIVWYEDKAAPKPVQAYVCALSKPTIGQHGLYGGQIKDVKEMDPDKQVFTKEKKVEEYESTTTTRDISGASSDVKQNIFQPQSALGKTVTTTGKKTVWKKVIHKEFPLLGTLVKRKGKQTKWKKKFDTLIQPWVKKPAGEFGPEVVGLVGSSTALVEFKLFWIAEEVGRTSEEEIDLPLEDIVRPSWYSTIWLNRSIGGAVYDRFFGTTAITDPLTVVDEFSSKSATDSETVEERAALSDIKSEEDPNFDLNTIMDLEQNTSIEASVDLLAYLYSVMKSKNYDIDEFIRAYTWRPVASMVDMFGTPDLELAYGEYQGDIFVEGREGESPVVAKKGLEGFHSRAFGDYKDLFGLVGPSIGSIIGIKNQFDPANSRLDVRRERHLRVLAYVLELRERGLLG